MAKALLFIFLSFTIGAAIVADAFSPFVEMPPVEVIPPDTIGYANNQVFLKRGNRIYSEPSRHPATLDDLDD